MDEPGNGLGESLLPYQDWTAEALRQVAIKALAHVAASGLPGNHHFYVSFRTDQPGVIVPTRLLAQYPQEMTIVLQHQFWDLTVDDETFRVSLSFGGVPATLTVPFTALTAFADPAVQLGLRLAPPPAAADAEDSDPDDAAEDAPQAPSRPSLAIAGREPAPQGDGPRPIPRPAPPQKPAAKQAAEERPDPDATDDAPPQVVSLDAFRRRTGPKEVP